MSVERGSPIYAQVGSGCGGPGGDSNPTTYIVAQDAKVLSKLMRETHSSDLSDCYSAPASVINTLAVHLSGDGAASAAYCKENSSTLPHSPRRRCPSHRPPYTPPSTLPKVQFSHFIKSIACIYCIELHASEALCSCFGSIL